jgi:hypothetical protein
VLRSHSIASQALLRKSAASIDSRSLTPDIDASLTT